MSHRSRCRLAGLLAISLSLTAGCGLFGGGEAKRTSRRPVSEILRERAVPEIEALRPGERLRRFRENPEVVDRIVAVVNQDAITLMDLLESLQFSLRQSGQELKPEEEPKFLEMMLEEMIRRRLQVQEALKEKVNVSDDEVREGIDRIMKQTKATSKVEFEAELKAQGLTLEGVQKLIREQILVDRIRQRKVQARFSVTDQEVEAYFKENREKLETGLAYHARHILIALKPPRDERAWEEARATAEEVWMKLQAGEPFEALAEQYSQDATAKEGGDLGQLKRGELAPEFETHIVRLAPGEVSPPVKTSLGYQLFKLESKEVLTGEALTQARQQIRDILFRDKQQQRYEAWLDELKRRAMLEKRL